MDSLFVLLFEPANQKNITEGAIPSIKKILQHSNISKTIIEKALRIICIFFNLFAVSGCVSTKELEMQEKRSKRSNYFF